MMAARAIGPTTRRMVTACESYLPMVKLMRKVVRLNDMENQIKVINKRSDELEVGVDIASRADVLVSLQKEQNFVIVRKMVWFGFQNRVYAPLWLCF